MEAEKIVNIDHYRDHRLSHVICLKCHHRWLGLRPANVKLIELECPNCNKQGFVIETGEILTDEEDCLINGS